MHTFLHMQTGHSRKRLIENAKAIFKGIRVCDGYSWHAKWCNTPFTAQNTSKFAIDVAACHGADAFAKFLTRERGPKKKRNTDAFHSWLYTKSKDILQNIANCKARQGMGPAGRKGWRDSSPANQLVLAERKLVLDAADLRGGTDLKSARVQLAWYSSNRARNEVAQAW